MAAITNDHDKDKDNNPNQSEPNKLDDYEIVFNAIFHAVLPNTSTFL